jgi:hypothetical protein
MSQPRPINVRLDRRLLEHPRAYHLRRMRAAIWLYLDLLARLPTGAGTIEVEPAAIGQDMGLPEGTVRSWLGHLRKSQYLDAVRLNGAVRVTIKGVERPTPIVDRPTSTPRFFTVAKLERALGEKDNDGALETALTRYSDSIVKRALAGALAVPAERIRRSRTALFIYLLKRHEQND